MGRREWNQELTLSPRYRNVLYVVDSWRENRLADPVSCTKREMVYVISIVEGFALFFVLR